MLAIARRQAIDFLCQRARSLITEQSMLLPDEAITLQPRERGFHLWLRSEKGTGQRGNIKSGAGMGAQEQQRLELRDGIDTLDDELSDVVRNRVGIHSKRQAGPSGNLPDSEMAVRQTKE